MPSHPTAELSSAPHAETNATAPDDAGTGRLVWLDIVRLLCAFMILGIHWLRACFKLSLFGSQSEPNLVIGYQGQSIGLKMLPHVLVAGTGHSLSAWLTNIIGLLGGFGWEGVSALIIVSGFSLTVSLKNRQLGFEQWFTWIKKRAVRILIPFYLVALPFLIIYLALLATVSHLHGGFAAGLDAKLHSVLQTPLLGIVLSHTLLVDPYNRQWQPEFFAPAWWFIPAILVAYVAYAPLRAAVRKLGTGPALILTAFLTVMAYRLADAGILANESWYFIVLQESFNLTLGVVVGNLWLNPRKRPALENILFGRATFIIALLLFIEGNLANWSPGTRPFASMCYGPGLVLMITVLAKALERTQFARLAASIDAYDLYLVHQPFAFPVALAAKMALHSYAVFFGWFVFIAIASIATVLLAFAQRVVFRKRPTPVSTRDRPLAIDG